MNSRGSGNKMYALTLFGLVSAACGLLVAGLVLPGVLFVSSAAKAAASGVESLPTELTIEPQMERSRILLKDGSVLAEFYDQNRVYMPLKNISTTMQKAQIAIEDHAFYDHGAIYLTGTLRALLNNSAGGSTQGGSTLTQQYVKQALIENALAQGDDEGVQEAQAETVSRKIRELRYAVAIEQKLSKDQILERYLNIAYYGDGAYGVEAAAKHYFNTSASKLTLAQSAMLAGIVQNPDAYDPVRHPAASIERRDVVLNRMSTLGWITNDQLAKAKATKFDQKLVQTTRNGCYSSKYPFICQYVYNTVIQKMPSLGKTATDRKNALNRDGLTIKTVIDPTIQDAAQKSMSSYVAPTDPVISVGVTVEPSTGLVTSMVQSRPTMGSNTKKGETWINYAVEESMGGAEGYQAGSTFKAFTIAAALAKGMSVQTKYVSSSPMNFTGTLWQGCQGPYRQLESWTPKNSTGSGYFNMVQAAQRSVNTYFIQLEQHAGLCNTVKMAEAAGVKSAIGLNLQSPKVATPAFTLGSVEVTPLSMASAYATFANGGVHCSPIVIAQATTDSGKALKVPSANCKRTMSEEVADGVSYVLQQVMKPGGTGYITKLPDVKNQAGKTGTTDSAASVWFDGFTPEVAGAAVIAADKGAAKFKNPDNRDITGTYVHGTSCGTAGCYLQGHGGTDAGRVWRGVMTAALKGQPDTAFPTPSDTVLHGKRVTVPDVSGKSLADARKALEAAGFSVSVTNQYSSYAVGTFLGIYPKAGTKVSLGGTVQLLVSAGQAPAQPSQGPTSSSTSQPSSESSKPASNDSGKPKPSPTGR